MELVPTHESALYRLRRALRHGDLIWALLIAGMAVVILATMAGIGWSVWKESAASRAEFGWGFILPTSHVSWDPVNDHFTAWPLIYGTLITALVAIVLATPVSVFVAIFLAELCPSRLRAPLGFTVEMLAAVPSVVFGLWGIFVFLPTVVVPVGRFLGSTLGVIPLFQGPIPASGMSRLGAGLVLTIMIIPTISAVSRDVFQAIPRAQRDARLSDRKCEMARVYIAETLPKMQAKATLLQAVDPAAIRARNILLEGPA